MGVGPRYNCAIITDGGTKSDGYFRVPQGGPKNFDLATRSDTRVRQSIGKYSWTPACNSQFKNSSGPPHVTVNLKIVLDIRVRQSKRK